MNRFVRFMILALGAISFSAVTFADFKVAVIGKTKNDSFYEKAFDGCETFSATVDDLICIYDGPEDYQNPRSQAAVVDRVLSQHVDGILISTTHSGFLVERILKEAQEKRVPVITFDSDLLPEHHSYRLAYVGTNNFDFGVALGEYARKFKKEGINEICIQSGSDATPNLNERIRGVRFALSGDSANKKLSGEKGWVEHPRCPFYTLGKRDTALNQLMFLLSQKQPPIFLAVAGFAQFSPDYLTAVKPYQQQIRSGDIVLISADAEAMQLEALQQHLSTANIGQRPFEMGRYSALLMYQYLKYQQMPEQEINYLGFYYCSPDKGCVAEH
ncbi:MAG: substrate-binding domain-containing protein [Oceanospirillum sp.]|nr:substrate-binding domain-containing protein [Oceanospirillum sp.]